MTTTAAALIAAAEAALEAIDVSADGAEDTFRCLYGEDLDDHEQVDRDRTAIVSDNQPPEPIAGSGGCARAVFDLSVSVQYTSTRLGRDRRLADAPKVRGVLKGLADLAAVRSVQVQSLPNQTLKFGGVPAVIVNWAVTIDYHSTGGA